MSQQRETTQGDAPCVYRYDLAMFGIDLFDASLLPALFVALVGGLISFASPCVLPIVPPYIAYMSGVSMAEMEDSRAARWRALRAALFFVLGLSTVFLLLGFAASSLGRFFLAGQDWFVFGAGVVVMIFGIHFLGIWRIAVLDREARIDGGDQGGSSLGAFLLGLAFAFGWTPCLGPILGTILSMAAQQAEAGKGMLLLGIYALGLGIPFLLVAAFFPRMRGLMGWMKRHMGQIERIMGLLLWTVGLLMITGQFTALSWWLLETFPGLAVLG